MKNFEFDGDWELYVDLPLFKASNNNWGQRLPTANVDEDVLLKIIDQRTLDPDPLKEQIAVIEYLLNHEEKVLSSLCNAFSEINKKYGASRGDHTWYEDFMDTHQLGSIFYVSEIAVLTEHKGGHAYLQFTGEYKGDLEHGLIVAFHKGRLIGFDQIGEDVYSELYSDLGRERDKFRKLNTEHNQFGLNMVHLPIAKYGKYKPWQLQTMEEYFENLIRAKKDELFKSEFEKSTLNVNFRFPFYDQCLIDMAVTQNNINVIEYLMKKGALASGALIKCTYRDAFNRDTISCLINHGVSIDTFTYQGMTPLGLEIKNLLWYVGSLANYKEGDARIHKAHQEIEKVKEKIQFYIDLGANPRKIDQKGNEYTSIILSHRNQSLLKKHRTKAVLEKVLFPNKTGNWKFWNR